MRIIDVLIAGAAVTAAACARDARPTTTAPAPAEPVATAPVGTDETQAPGMQSPAGGDDTTGGAVAGAPGDITAFVDPGAPGDVSARRPVSEAVAVLHDLRTNRAIGTVRFIDRSAGTAQAGTQGLEIRTMVEGLPAGTHAYHVHVYGDCSSPDGKTAGPHFHFAGSSFDNSVRMITGNLGELTPTPEGRAVHSATIPDARLQGAFSLIGRSVVIHAKGNDPKVTPDGGAGDRLACGVIGVASPGAPSGTSAQR